MTLETFFALQGRPSGDMGELIGGALRVDTTTSERARGFYLRLEAMDAVPVHGFTGDPNFHAEAGVMYRPRLQRGPLGVGITLSAGPAAGWVRERSYGSEPPMTENRLTIGAAADAAIDVHVYFMTLSFQTRWRSTVGSQGPYHTWSIGPNLGAHW